MRIIRILAFELLDFAPALAFEAIPMIRKAIFWIHLSCGVVAGLVILMMSATGVLLTYERQILAWAENNPGSGPAEGAPLSLAGLVAAVSAREPDFRATTITIAADPEDPVAIGAGRTGTRYVNRYTGEILGPGATGLREFFDAVTGWHRWFNVDTDARAPYRAVTGASNLILLFLILSGMYLWLPRMYAWAAFRTRLLFETKPATSRARDFNWHHVLGIWSAIPLAVIVASATVFYYPWANDLVYRTFGEEPPQRGRAAPPAPVATSAGGTPGAEKLPIDTLFASASAQLDSWRRITVQLPADGESTVRFTLDQGNGGQPQRRHTLTLDAYTGDVAAWQPFTSQTPGQRARSYLRFLHTGEALGVIGQTIAGLVSLTSVIMVWTGLALAYRRLIAPLVRRVKER